MRKGGLLALLMILGLAAGVFYGQYVLRNPVAPVDEFHWTRTAGEFILLRPMTLIALPIAFVGMVVGTASVGRVLRLSLMSASTLAFFLASSLISVSIGLFAADRWQPGAMPAAESQTLIETAQANLTAASAVDMAVQISNSHGTANPGGAWMEIVRSAVPFNVVGQMTAGNILGILLLAMLLGAALGAAGESTAPALAAFRALMDALLIITRWLAWLAPVGVMLLTAYAIGRTGLDSLRGPLSRFVLIVVAGLGAHALVALPVVMLLLAGRNPWSLLWRMRQPLALGLGTASSVATLPVAIHSARAYGGCSMAASGFVIPLGAAVHRCGTALFQAVAAVFLCQVYGITLEFGDFVLVAITAVLASIAASGVPGAGLITLVIVLSALNTTLAGRGLPQIPAHALGILVGIDLLLDACRTLVNVWGNLVAARVITRLAPDPVH